MGSCSSSEKHAAIPSKIINIKQNPVQHKEEKLEHMIKPNHIKAKDSKENFYEIKEYECYSGEKGESSEEIKINPIPELPSGFKYESKEVGIGEYYLTAELIELQNSKSRKETQKDKIKKVEKIIHDIKNLLNKTQQRIQLTELNNETDIYLSEYSKRKPHKYLKLFKNGGPPMKYRWSLWKNRLDLNKHYIEGLYNKFRYMKTSYENDIKKDIHRTFPEEAYFSSEVYNYIGQEQLFRVLKAISIYLGNIGYCQGMNFIVAFLLMINGGNEQEAFWFFVSLARNHDFMIMGFFEKNFPLLNLYHYIFYEIFKKEMPALYEYLSAQQIPDQLWITKWLLTMFLYSLPPKIVVRIWDFIFSENLFSLIKVSIGLLKMVEIDLMKLDTMGFDILLRHIKGDNHKLTQEDDYAFNVQSIDPEALLKISKKITLTNEQISQYTRDYVKSNSVDSTNLYYKFFSDYNNNTKNITTIENFQSEIDGYLLKFSLEIKKKNKDYETDNIDYYNNDQEDQDHNKSINKDYIKNDFDDYEDEDDIDYEHNNNIKARMSKYIENEEEDLPSNID